MLLATAVGPAYAADNLPPKQPLIQDLQSQGKACATGDDTPYVSTSPRLSAMLYDPEEDNQPSEYSPVKGEFEAWWTDAAGVEQRLTYTTITLSSGSRQYWTMPDDIPANTVVPGTSAPTTARPRPHGAMRATARSARSCTTT